MRDRFIHFAGERVDSRRPGARPAGALRASKIAPGDFVDHSAISPICSFFLSATPSRETDSFIMPGSALTRAVLALALWAHCVRPKSLPAILSTTQPSLRSVLYSFCNSVERDRSIHFAGERVDSRRPGARPAGALRASKIAPCDFVDHSAVSPCGRARTLRCLRGAHIVLSVVVEVKR